jgi:rhodanese-related sulfurtransferase
LNKRYLSYFAAVLLAFLIIAPGITSACETYTNVSVSEAKNLIEEGDIFILDVRTPAEYNLGHIEGAVLIPLKNVPANSTALSPEELLPARMKELPCNKNTKILAYCKVGKRGAEASSLLADAGYKNVYNIDYGIDQWVKEGYPIVATYESWNNVWYLLLSPQQKC